jgi:hypothetical protein
MWKLWNKQTTVESPYLRPGRLADVIAAIQCMAVYKFYKLSFSAWADRIAADETQSQKWATIFSEHPEFFRLDSARQKASLVWRRQFPKRYDVDEERALSERELLTLPPPKIGRLSRLPLTPADVKTLIDTAVNLHSRALEQQKDRRWWLPILTAAAALVGSVAGALIKK